MEQFDCQKDEQVIVYLSNKDKKETKQFKRFNYPLLFADKLKDKKLMGVKMQGQVDKGLLGIDVKQIIALAGSPIKSDFVKIIISPEQKEYEGKKFYPYQIYEVNENEEIKLKLQKKLDLFKSRDYTFDVEI